MGGTSERAYEALRSRVDALRGSFPELRVESEAVLSTLGASGAAFVEGAELSDRDLEAAILVTACLEEQPRAHAAFEARYFGGVRPALRSLGLDDAAISDVEQRVRVKLFVADESGAAPVVGYLGKGDLRAFVRVMATRLALSDRRKQKPQEPEEALARVAHGADPQLRYLEASQHAAFRDAVEAAAAALEVEERVLLRLHYVDGLTVDEIGATYGVHRATAARRVARARTRLTNEVRAVLKETLRLGTVELDSLMRDAQSDLDVSISRILRR